jgi:hypothetical protein
MRPPVRPRSKVSRSCAIADPLRRPGSRNAGCRPLRSDGGTENPGGDPMVDPSTEGRWESGPRVGVRWGRGRRGSAHRPPTVRLRHRGRAIGHPTPRSPTSPVPPSTPSRENRADHASPAVGSKDPHPAAVDHDEGVAHKGEASGRTPQHCCRRISTINFQIGVATWAHTRIGTLALPAHPFGRVEAGFSRRDRLRSEQRN